MQTKTGFWDGCVGVLGVVLPLLVGCSSNESGSASAVGQGGAASANGAAETGEPLAVSVGEDCSAEQASCNGKCLAEGESTAGCHVLSGGGLGMYEFALDGSSLYAATVEAGTRYSIVKYDKSTLTAQGEIEGAFSNNKLWGLAVSETHVGWIEDSNVYQVPPSLSSARKGAAVELELFGAEDIEAIYGTPQGWLVRTSIFASSDDLNLVPYEGGEANIIGKGPEWLSSSGQVVADSFYFVRDGQLSNDSLWRQPLDGSEAQLLSEDDMFSFYADGESIYYVEGKYSNRPRRIAKIPAAGGTAEILSEDFLLGGEELYGFGDWLYFTRNEKVDDTIVYTLVAFPKAGGTEKLMATSNFSFDDIEVDASGVYFLQQNYGTATKLMRVDLAE